jgi:hypothetical protein
MASGSGRLYFSRLLYKPVPGVRKSGMPAEHEIPAPLNHTILLHIPLLISSAMPAKFSVLNGHLDLFETYWTYGVIGFGPHSIHTQHPMVAPGRRRTLG